MSSLQNVVHNRGRTKVVWKSRRRRPADVGDRVTLIPGTDTGRAVCEAVRKIVKAAGSWTEWDYQAPAVYRELKTNRCPSTRREFGRGNGTRAPIPGLDGGTK